MTDNWQEMDTAPKDEAVIICPVNCVMQIAIQVIGEIHDPNSTKSRKGYIWRPYPLRYHQYGGYDQLEPRMWRPLPLPPKHLYERKLTADLLAKQVEELRR